MVAFYTSACLPGRGLSGHKAPHAHEWSTADSSLAAAAVLASCSEPQVRITNDKPAPQQVAPRSEPIFYNGKTYRLDFSPKGSGVYDMAVSGMSSKQQKDAEAVATSSLGYYACPDGQRGKLQNKPAYSRRQVAHAGQVRLSRYSSATSLKPTLAGGTPAAQPPDAGFAHEDGELRLMRALHQEGRAACRVDARPGAGRRPFPHIAAEVRDAIGSAPKTPLGRTTPETFSIAP